MFTTPESNRPRHSGGSPQISSELTEFLRRQKHESPVEYVLDSTEKSTLEELAASITVDATLAPDWFCRQAQAVSRSVPEELADFVRSFDDVGNAAGFAVVKGLPIGPLPNTPPDNALGLAGVTVLAKVSAIIGSLIGHQLAYEAEGHGYLFQDMVPNRALACTQQSQGSRVELEAHTEQCFSELRPDYILLGCLRGDPMAETYVMTAAELESHFTPAERIALRQPMWTTTIDESFRPYVPEPDAVRGPFPILSGSEHDPSLRLDQDLMRGITQEAQGLFRKAIRVYQKAKASYVLQPGDLLLLDNYRAMHGRSVFLPRFDGGDRWIARGFLVRDRRRFAHALGEDGRTVLAKHS